MFVCGLITESVPFAVTVPSAVDIVCHHSEVIHIFCHADNIETLQVPCVLL